RGDDEAGTGAEVLRGHLVVTAPGRVGPDVDAVAGDDYEDDQANGHADPGGDGQGHERGQGQGQEDLVGSIGHRREQVGGEDGRRYALLQGRRAPVLTAEGPSNE